MFMRQLAATTFMTFAIAFTCGAPASAAEAPGGSNGTPGEDESTSSCAEAYGRQESRGTLAGGGPKAEAGVAPNNCDQFFQATDVIGPDETP